MFMTATSPHIRFREARERAGLSIDEVASRSGISDLSIYDLEQFERDLTCCYSPKELQQLCDVIGISPIGLFGDTMSEAPVSVDELIGRIHEECKLRSITPEQFEDVVGWRLSECMQPPELLLEDITIDGLQWLCRELRIDWRRAFLGLER
jgi:transcriptional regulator with XRE-family HTH domain